MLRLALQSSSTSAAPSVLYWALAISILFAGPHCISPADALPGSLLVGGCPGCTIRVFRDPWHSSWPLHWLVIVRDGLGRRTGAARTCLYGGRALRGARFARARHVGPRAFARR